MKAVLTDRAFSDPGWVFERKLDGIRCGAIRRRRRRAPDLAHRPGPDAQPTRSWSRRSSSRRPGLRSPTARSSPSRASRTSFERLQGRMGIHDPRLARLHRHRGLPLRLRPARVRRPRPHRPAAARAQAACCARLRFARPVRFTTHRDGARRGAARRRLPTRLGGPDRQAGRQPLPGTARARDWLKLKCTSSRSW